MSMSPSPTVLTTAGLREQRQMLIARYDSGAMAPAIFVVVKIIECEISWREYCQHQPGVNAPVNPAIPANRNLPTTEEIHMGDRSHYCYGTSQYLKGADFVGKRVDVTICGVEDVEFEKGLKPVLSFTGHVKKLVVNMTNFDTLADAFGGFTEKWIGKTITLVGEKVNVKGKREDSIRVRIPPAATQVPAAQPPAGDHDVDGADIPF